jgi:glycosyltransferase involved in cell wall biosynthesis
VNKIYIFSTKDKISTSRYFQKASKKIFRQTCYITSQKSFDLIKNKIKIEDIFLFIDPTNDFPLGIEKINCLKVIYLIDTHISRFQLNHRLLLSNFFDCIFINHRQHLNRFIKFKYPNVKNLEQTKDIHWLPVACDAELHYKNIKNKRNYDIAFVGQIGPSTSFRHKFLKKIFFSDNLTNIEKKYTNGISDKLMSKIYGNSKIVPNVSINEDINMRYYEAMAAGSLLLANKIKNSGIDKLFTENIDYISYTNEEDAIKKIKFYLKNPSKRIKISKNGQKKVLAYNTYENRLKNIINLSKNLKNNSSSKNFSSIKLAEEYTKIYSILRKPEQIIKVIQIYGFNFFVFKNLLLSTLRLINVHIPLTKNALKQYFFVKKINKLYYKI